MAMIIQHRFVDLLRDDVSRDFTEALQDEMAPLMTKRRSR